MTETLLAALCSALTSSILSALAAFIAAGRRYSIRQQATFDGLQCLLRAEIIRSYEKSLRRGYCPLYAKDALKRAYSSYHNLGGNDVATGLYRQILQMNTEPTDKENPT